MTFRRTLVLAAVFVSASAAANAQSAWPNAQPQAQSAWPSQPQAQPQQAPWPSSSAAAAPAQQPQQAPWPASTPQAQPMAAPPMGGGGGGFGGPPMGGGGGGGFGGPPGGGGGGGLGGPPAECTSQFTALRAEVEKRGMAARAGGEKRVSREEMCKLVTEYSAAETKWIKFVEGNMSKCGIPKEIVTQLKGVHAKTTDGQKKLCAAGPAAAAATPTLSDALGTATQAPPATEKKRKPGGTMDTLTGNALGQ